MTASFQLVTFMELLEHNAEAFWRLSSLVGQLFTRLETGLPDLNVVASNLGELRREAERLSIRSAVVQNERITDLVQGDLWGGDLQRLAGLMRPLVVDLHLRIMDDLDARFFLAIPPESVSYYNQKQPLFGSKVESKFSQMSECLSDESLNWLNRL